MSASVLKFNFYSFVYVNHCQIKLQLKRARAHMELNNSYAICKLHGERESFYNFHTRKRYTQRPTRTKCKWQWQICFLSLHSNLGAKISFSLSLPIRIGQNLGTPVEVGISMFLISISTVSEVKMVSKGLAASFFSLSFFRPCPLHHETAYLTLNSLFGLLFLFAFFSPVFLPFASCRLLLSFFLEPTSIN